MEVAGTKRRDSETTKERILDVALVLFSQNGYDATTTREICKKADVNINLIYYYFGGKKELYDALIVNLVQNQKAYMEQFIDFETDFSKLRYDEKVQLLSLSISKVIDFLYKAISKDQVRFFLKVQQDPRGALVPPMYVFLSNLLASILNMKVESKEVVYKLLFLMSQVAFPRLVPIFSLKILSQENFNDEDIEIIKENVQEYISATYSKKSDKKCKK